MKRALIFPALGGLLFLLGSCTKKSDPTAATDTFFRELGTGHVKEAYKGAAFKFQAQQDLALFEQTARELGLTEFASAAWETPEMDGRTAKVRGEVTTKGGAKVPMLVILTEESGGWRVFQVKKPREVQTGLAANLFGTLGKGTGFNAPVSLPMPPESEVREMTLETLTLFNQAIRIRNFDAFYGSVSNAWKTHLTTGALGRAFQPFIDKDVRIDGIKEQKAVFEPAPYINTDGFLIATGYYPTTPYRVNFSLKFAYELPRWKLFGIDVNVQE